MKILIDGGHRFNKGNCMIIAFVGEAIKGRGRKQTEVVVMGWFRPCRDEDQDSISAVVNNNMFSGQNGHDSDFSQVLTTW